MRVAVPVLLIQLGVSVFLSVAAPRSVSGAVFADVITINTVAETASGQVNGVDFLVEATLLFPNAQDNGGFALGGGVTDGSDTSFNSPRFTPSLPMADSLLLWASSDFRITFSQPVTNFRLHVFELANNRLSFTTDGTPASLSLLSSDGDITIGPGTVMGLDAGNPGGQDNASGTIAFDGTFSELAWTSNRVTPVDAIKIQFSAVAAVPEPSSIALFGMGGVAFLGRVIRRLSP